MIFAFAASTDQPIDESTVMKYEALLSLSDQVKISRFHLWQDARLTLLGRCLLIKGLTQFGFSTDKIRQLEFSRFKKPFLRDAPNFNISHSGKYVVCVISDNEIGVDIEEIKTLDIDDFKDHWTEDEWSRIVGSSKSLEQFYRYWTRKEAIIKADGRGMMIPLNKISVVEADFTLDATRWFYTDIEIAPNYCCSIASLEKPDREIAVQFVDFANTNLFSYERT